MDDKAAEEKKEDKKEPSALDLFERAFEEAVAGPPKEQPPAEELVEEEEPEEPPAEKPPEEEPPKEAEKEKEEPKAEPPVEAAKEQARQPVKEEPKAPEPEREEPVREPEPEKVDYSLFFKGLENDIEDAAARKEYAEFMDDSADLGKFAVTTSELVGKRLITYVNESFKVLVERLSPYLEATRKSMEREHASSISVKHQDYQNLRKSGDVLSWIKEQPKYMQRSLMAVYDNGEPEDVVDMLDRYKKDRGLLQEPKEEPARDAEKDAARKQTEEKIKEKIDNLAVVKTKQRPISAQGARTAPAEDFDGAFEEAVTRRK